jgi:DNA polymerase-3 subunit epsilon/CBS domain-containing protein
MQGNIAEVSSETPLMSLSAVVVDTETTGLDTRVARIVQIGGVRLSKGRVCELDAYDRLVNPGLPIPTETTKIHHITDAHVADAPAARDVLPHFRDWCGTAIVLGYSIGFDLAVLEAEHGRAGLAWQPPRSLDVRHLVQVLSPPLPDQELDTVARWLGVAIEGRHQALADARAAARMFLALVPKLRAQGIRTLAEAELACRGLAAQRSSEAQAGWHEVEQAGGRRAPGALARIDSFPYRHRVRDIMNAPALTVPAGMSLRAVLSLLMGEQVSSVFVHGTSADPAWGIVTERDILRAVDKDPDALEKPADAFAARPLRTVASDEFVYRAIGRMSQGGFRHLGVHGADGALVGAVSARDLLRQRASDAISLGDEIDAAATPQELGLVWAKLAMVARGLAYEEVDARDIAAIVSRELRALTRRACEIAEAEMAARGEGHPPVPYAMMVLGSGGRGESLLAMDQDNAIVFTQGEPGSAQDLWLEALGRRVCDILNMVGVRYCDGGIMAANAQWRMSAARWRTMVGGWIGRSRPQDILHADIFYDARPVHGAMELADALRADALAAAAGSRTFLHLLAHNAADVRTPVGWFGRFRLKEGRMDLKKGGIMPIFSGARVLALQEQNPSYGTPQRLQAAAGLESANTRAIDNLIDAHRILLGAILAQQLRDLEAGIPPSNSVAPKELSAHQRDEIRWALAQVPAIAGLLGDPAIAS